MKKYIVVIFLFILLSNINLIKVNASEFANPLQDDYSITSEFGYRIHPVTYKYKMHNGIDLSAPEDTPVYASNSGTVAVAQYDSEAGNFIKIEDDTNYTRYLHLESMLVDVGDEVVQGEQIGTVGNTGLSTGSHLHFEIAINNTLVNPRNYVAFENSDVSPVDVEVSLFVVEHTTGSIKMMCNGVLPIKVYKSFDGSNYSYMQDINTNIYTEYGLDNGTTVWYKIEDYYGNTATARYTPPYVTIEMYPLRVVEIGDNEVHLSWDNYIGEIDLYLDGELVAENLDVNEYSISDLTEGTEYQVYAINKFNERTNTISFKTHKNLSAIEKLLTKIFISDMSVDSDSDGLPDKLDDIQNKLEEITDNLGGQLIEDTAFVVDSSTSSYDDPDFAQLSDLPKIETEWYGMQIKILDLENEWLYDNIIVPLRYLILVILTLSYVFLIIAIFDINFKV